VEAREKIMKRKLIYLDYAASTPVDKRVHKAMLPFFKREFANPSSSHLAGQAARAGVETAREQVAAFLGCLASEVIFTSGASEANNLAIQGVVRNAQFENPHLKPHVITCSIEHESVLAPIEYLQKQGLLEATYITVGKQGVVRPKDVQKAMQKSTILISIQYANSEVGTVQPIGEISKLLKSHKAVFHTDAVQAANYLNCNVEKLGVHLLTLSSHKVYGPKGAGVLYVKKGVSLAPIILGGGQEQDMRSGTENVPGIVGMGEAVSELSNPKNAVQAIKIRQLKDWFLKEAEKKISGVRTAGSLQSRLPNNAHLLIEGVEGKDVVLLLDRKGIEVSAGSACSERSKEASHVLLAMGHKEKEALGALRITLGKYTKKEDMQKALKALQGAVEQLRQKK
jgi:cysteine desulfurase